MARKRNRARAWIAALGTRALIQGSRLLPLTLACFLSRAGGRLLAHFVPRVRRVAMENLDRAYGDSLSPRDKDRIYREVVDNLCTIAAEFSRLKPLASPGRIAVEGAENIQRGQGYLCIGAHLGNWELMGPAMAAHGFAVAEVVRPFDDPRVDRLIDSVRTGAGVQTVSKHNAAGDILRYLKSGYLVGVMIDQSPRENGVPVRFFGHPCWATVAPAMIAVRARVPIVPVSLVRGAGRDYTLRFGPPLVMERTGNLRRDLMTYSQACQDAIEALVRETPGQWLWLHRRWKERPALADEWDRRTARDTRED